MSKNLPSFIFDKKEMRTRQLRDYTGRIAKKLKKILGDVTVSYFDIDHEPITLSKGLYDYEFWVYKEPFMFMDFLRNPSPYIEKFKECEALSSSSIAILFKNGSTLCALVGRARVGDSYVFATVSGEEYVVVTLDAFLEEILDAP